MICKNCGEVLPDRSQKCSRCGIDNPNLYAAQNPYIPFQSTSPPSTPEPFGVPTPSPYPLSGSTPPASQSPSLQNNHMPLPYSATQYHPSSLSSQPVNRSKVILAITLAVAAVLVFSSLFFIGVFSDQTAYSTSSQSYSYSPLYHVGETAVLSGLHQDTYFENSSCISEITMEELLIGESANSYMEGLGADLSYLESTENYAVARFQVKLLSSNSNNPIYFGDYDFAFYDANQEEYCTLVSYDIQPESIRLTEGLTGEVILFAVTEKNADLQVVYFNEDNSLTVFAP